MKVLVSAFSCCPERGSEPGVGWNWVQQISKEHEVWLLTTDEFQREISQAISSGSSFLRAARSGEGGMQLNPPPIHPTFIPSFRIWDWLLKRFIPGLDWLYYYWWQWKAYRVARRLHAKIGFDLAHHVTFVSWRAPSFLCLLGIPFIWGPVGGGGTPPHSLASELGWKGRLSEGFRSLCQQFPRFDPCVRLTMRRAKLILANVPETADLIPASFRSKARLMFGIGMSVTDRPKLKALLSKGNQLETKEVPSSVTFVALFAAQLRPIKGGTLAIKAFAQLAREQPSSCLVILGEGSERGRLESLAGELAIKDKVRFLGWLNHDDVLKWMQSADVLLHPSLRDSGGMVLLEAMALQKPVVCLDLGGPAHIVTTDCGFKIRPGNPAQVVDDLAAALKALAADRTLGWTLGQAGLRRVRDQYDWTSRGEQMMKIYHEVAGTQAPYETKKRNCS